MILFKAYLLGSINRCINRSELAEGDHGIFFETLPIDYDGNLFHTGVLKLRAVDGISVFMESSCGQSSEDPSMANYHHLLTVVSFVFGQLFLQL